MNGVGTQQVTNSILVRGCRPIGRVKGLKILIVWVRAPPAPPFKGVIMEYMLIKFTPYEGEQVIYNLSKEDVLNLIKGDIDDSYTIHPMPTKDWDGYKFTKEFS